MPNEQQTEKLPPRLKAQPTEIDPEMLVGIGPKGGISLYIGGQRFPVTLYKNQWDKVQQFMDSGEYAAFCDENTALLAAERPATVREGKPELFSVNENDLAIVNQHAKELAKAGQTSEAVDYLAIAGTAKALGGKVDAPTLYKIMTLKANKGQLK